MIEYGGGGREKAKVRGFVEGKRRAKVRVWG